MAKTQNPFSNSVSQAIAANVTAYQWGAAVPKSPEQFEKDLRDEAKGYAINWDESVVGSDAALVDSAVELYKNFYASLVNQAKSGKGPDNPTPEFDVWYQEQQ